LHIQTYGCGTAFDAADEKLIADAWIAIIQVKIGYSTNRENVPKAE